MFFVAAEPGKESKRYKMNQYLQSTVGYFSSGEKWDQEGVYQSQERQVDISRISKHRQTKEIGTFCVLHVIIVLSLPFILFFFFAAGKHQFHFEEMVQLLHD
jgi:hypothetical protein